MGSRDAHASDGAGTSLYVGTYARAGGSGLYPLRGNWSLGDAYDGACNASFGAYSERFGLHYLVDEQADGALGVYRESATGLQRLERVATHGAEPCYVALDREETFLAVANYGSGSIALFRLDPKTGLPIEPPAVGTNSGNGPVSDRQDGPHAHCAVFDRDGWLYQVDLGTDEILAFRFDGEAGGLGERKVAFHAPAGSGPRHLIIHPRRPVAFLVSEPASSVSVLDLADGLFSTREVRSTLPDGYSGESLGGHLALNAAGDRLYVSNRGHDSIAAFAVDEAGGLSLLQHVPSGGASPRFFLLLETERRLVVANEEGGNVTAFEIAADGKLTRLDVDVRVPGPAFLLASRLDQ